MGVGAGLLSGGLLLVLLSLSAQASDLQKAASGNQLKAGTFCEDYSICLLKLEGKQRECLSQQRNHTASTALGKKSDFAEECSSKKRQLRHDIRVLQHRKTEVTRDCVSKNLRLAEPVLDDQQEKRCSEVRKTLEKFTVPVRDVVSKKHHRTSRDRRSIDKQSREHHCHHQVAQLERKCHVLAGCCSTSTECGLDAARLHDQVFELKQELHKVRAQCDPNMDQETLLRL
uniref:Extracellular protein n=1 Tax=Steinernema glaseri TaxID=37863 RepID=A0A1I7Z497_9BILA